MATPTSTTSQVVRFGVFELDLRAGELRKNGVKVKLEGQPLTILTLLVERPGQVVTREELRQKLWPADTFVDFEHSINVAVKRLREALQDSATAPHLIETLPRHGYRFIYPLSGTAATLAVPAPRPRRWLVWLLPAVAVGVLLAVAVAANVAGVRERLFGRTVIKAIAVLPLRAESPDPEQEYLADAFTEMLITELGKIGDLDVPSHQSVRRFARSDMPAPEIASALKVDALVEGTVLQTGNKVRVTVNVVLMNPERHLISEPFVRDVGNLFAVQTEVAEAIANRVRHHLPAEASCPPPRVVAPEVAQAYAAGLAYVQRGTENDRSKAAEFFQQAIEADPEFAPGYASLALLRSHGGAGRQGGGARNRAVTRVWAEKALQLDPCQAEAHTALAWSELEDWNWQGAELEFERAIRLNPNFATARSWYAEFLVSTGHPGEAVSQAEVVFRLDAKNNNLVHAAWVLGAAGRVEDEIRHLRAVMEQDPKYFWAHEFLAESYLRKEMYREAVGEFEEAARLSQPDIVPLGMLAYAYARNGQRVEAERIARDLDARARQALADGRWIGPNVMVPAYLAVGDKEKALAYLETAYERQGPGMLFVASSEQYRPLRSEPRFQDLLRGLGLPAASDGR